jgi:hypothetical protein
MTTTATTSLRTTSNPIVYRLALDNTEAVFEFDFEDTVARTLADIPGYAFTVDGRAISLKGQTPKYLSPGKADGVYRYVNLPWRGRRKSFLLHRLLARAFIPNPQSKPQVNHLNANPGDNSVSNLEWATEQENADHRRIMAKPLRRATPEQLAQAVTLHRSGLSKATVAEELNISYRAAAKAILKAAQAA